MNAMSPGIGHNGGPSIWEPQPGPQALAIGAPFIDELLFGGARGGGKSDFLLGDFLQDVGLGPIWRGIIFRQSHPELEELMVRAREIFIPLGAKERVSDKIFVFPSGATLKFRHLETERDADLYQGHQYTWIGWDELGAWENLNAYRKLKACLRSAHEGIPHKRIRASANPGGVGHHAVKNYFMPSGTQPLNVFKNVEEYADEFGVLKRTTTTRIFIPSRVKDNKILMRNDPGYVGRLREVGSPELVKAWLDGDWNVITGAYFPEFSTAKHVLRPFAIPEYWTRFRSGDWGSARPFSFHWHAVSDGHLLEDGRFIPQGAVVTYREFYGCQPGKVNEGVRWSANRVGRRIVEMERGENISYGVIDPSAFKWDGGPSHAEIMATEGAFFRKADNNRIGGWDMVRNRLCGVLEDAPLPMHGGPVGDILTNTTLVGTPMWYCFDTCVHLIRTLPALQHDINNPEDCDTNGEDHAPDDLRYGLMSRPWSRPKHKVARVDDIKLLQKATLNDIWADHDEHEGMYL